MPRVGRGISVAGWLVAAGMTLLLVTGSADVPLLDPDESRFARTSVEMLRSHDLVVPHFQGEPRLVKPPLLHWVQSFVFRWAGVSSWSARLHAILATLGSLLLVTWIARRRFGAEGGVWAGAIFATMPLVLVPGRLGTLDALLAVHVLAVVGLDLVGSEEEHGASRALCTGGMLGLGFLIKGPVGVVLPLLILLAGRSVCRREVAPSFTTVLRTVAGWALIVLPWGLAFVDRLGWQTAFTTLQIETVDRYFGGAVHVEPFWFYGPVLAAGLAPWLAPLVLAFVRLWRMRGDPAARTAAYCGAALVVGVVFFSIGQGKLASYVVPLAPFAAILVAWEIGRQVERPETGSGLTLLAGTLAGAAVLLGLASGRPLQGGGGNLASIGMAIFAVGATVTGYAAWKRWPRLAYAAVVVTMGVFLFVVVTVLFPQIAQTKSAAPLIDAVPELASGRPLVTVEVRIPGLTYYLDRVVEVVDMGEFEARLARGDDALYLLADVDLPRIPSSVLSLLRPVGRQGKFHVFEKQKRG